MAGRREAPLPALPGLRYERASNAKAELNFSAHCSMKLFKQVVHPKE